MKPKIIAIILTIASAISFFFLIWTVDDVRNQLSSRKALIIMGFVFVLLTFLAIIAILILIMLKNKNNFQDIDKVGKILCIVSLIILLLGVLFYFIGSCILLKDYGKYSAPGKYWAGVIVPLLFLIASTVIIIFCINALYYIFSKNIDSDTDIEEYERNPKKQNSQERNVTVQNIAQNQTNNNITNNNPMLFNNAQNQMNPNNYQNAINVNTNALYNNNNLPK
jgi:uncharacterized BrkB/YihY/UPF0761 family membrane protein